MDRVIRGILKEILYELLAFIGLAGSMALCWHSHNAVVSEAAGIMLCIVYLLTFIICFMCFNWGDLITFLMFAIIMPLGEVVLVNSGVWTYHAIPAIAGVPIWLPFSWGFMAVIIRKMSNTIDTLIWVYK